MGKKKKNLGGRPMKDISGIIKKINDYAAGGWEHVDAFPSITGAARYVGILREELRQYAETRPGLYSTLQAIKDDQRQVVLNKSITGEFNGNIAKLVLSHNHGFIERKEKVIKSKKKVKVVRVVRKSSRKKD